MSAGLVKVKQLRKINYSWIYVVSTAQNNSIQFTETQQNYRPNNKKTETGKGKGEFWLNTLIQFSSLN